MKTFITFIGIFLLTISCYSETLVKEELTSPPLQLREKGITKENIDHIMIKFMKDNPRYHYLIFHPLTIKWVIEGLYNLQLISARSNQDGKIPMVKCNAEIELYLKDSHVLIVPFVFNEVDYKRRFRHFSKSYEPDKNFYAVLYVCYDRFHLIMYEPGKPGPLGPFNDNKDQKMDFIGMAEYFNMMDCPELVVEFLEKKLTFDKKNIRWNPDIGMVICSFYIIPMINHQYDLMIDNLCKLNRYDEAIKWCKLHMELFSDYKGMGYPSVPYQKLINTDIIKKIADIYKEKGDLKNAKNYYNQALSLNEDILKTLNEDDKNFKMWKKSLDSLKEKIARCP